MFGPVLEPEIKDPMINSIPEARDPRCFKRSPSTLIMSYSPHVVEWYKSLRTGGQLFVRDSKRAGFVSRGL